MPTADVGEIFAASVSGMATILLISAVGVYLALRPKLPRPVLHADALRQLSRLIVTMCWPAMATYGVGKALDGEKLASLWPLLVMPLVNLLVGYLVTMAMCQVMQTSARLTPALVVSGMFANSAALPLVLLSALCRQPILSDVEDCDDRSLAYIMVYTIPWSVCFFVVAMPWLKKVAAPPPDCEDRRPPFALLGLECNAAAWKAALCTGPMGGTAFGVLCALWPWLQDNLFRQASVLRPVGLMIESCAAPAVNLFTIVMAASLIPPGADQPQPPPQPSSADKETPPEEQTELAAVKDDGTSDEEEAAGAEEAEVGAAAGVVVSVEQQEEPVGEPAAKEEEEELFDVKLGLVFSLLRLAVIPGLALAVQYAIVKMDFMPFDKLGLLVCYLEMVVPSAQMGIVVLQQLGCSKMASQLAQLVALQYVLAAFTLTGFTALVIFMVEQQQLEMD